MKIKSKLLQGIARKIGAKRKAILRHHEYLLGQCKVEDRPRLNDAFEYYHFLILQVESEIRQQEWIASESMSAKANRKRTAASPVSAGGSVGEDTSTSPF